MEKSVPKRRNMKFRSRGITQKKAYNVQNKAKVWNQESKLYHWQSPWNFTESIFVVLAMEEIKHFQSDSGVTLTNLNWSFCFEVNTPFLIKSFRLQTQESPCEEQKCRSRAQIKETAAVCPLQRGISIQRRWAICQSHNILLWKSNTTTPYECVGLG